MSIKTSQNKTAASLDAVIAHGQRGQPGRPRSAAKRTADRKDTHGAEAMRTVSMRLPIELVDELKRLANAQAWPYQALARSILTDFVAVRTKG